MDTPKNDACVIGRAIRDLPDPYGPALAGRINSNEPADGVAYSMRVAGVAGSASAIRLHRRGFCACPLKGNK
jgi:hypothetical protein